MRNGSSRNVSRRPALKAPARRGIGAHSSTVADLGEFELIDRLSRILGRTAPASPAGPGDDAAVLNTTSSTLITTDVQEEGVHFRRTWTLPEELGRRAMEVNVSDIAAMGGIPTSALISLVIPPSLPLAALDGLYRGVARSAKRTGVQIIGGNVSRSGAEQLSITVTLIGRPAGDEPILRSGGQPGDLILVTGTPGLAGLGLHLVDEAITGGPSVPASKRPKHKSLWIPGKTGRFSAPEWLKHLAASSPVARAALRRFLTPEARTEMAALAAVTGVTAMIDLSDGLSADLAHLVDASQAGAALDPRRLPLMRGMEAFCAARNLSAVDLALSGGEDYELLFTLPEKKWNAFVSAARSRNVKTPFAIIGRLTEPDDGLTVMKDGKTKRLKAKGHRHF